MQREVNYPLHASRFTLLLFLSPLITGCSAKAPPAAGIPEIPPRSVSEPSSLAYDGINFYAADWTSAGVVKFSADGSSELIKFSGGAPIQIAALAREKLIVETNESKLFLWEPGAAPKPVFYGHDRQPGSPLCWDGLYLWMVHGNLLFAAFLMPDSQLIRMPNREIRLPDILDDNSASGFSLACGWNKFHALARKEGDDVLLIDFFNSAPGGPNLWSLNDFRPIAISLIDKKRLVVFSELKEKKGFFKLIEVGTGPKPT